MADLDVSVVIPVLNAAQHLPALFDALSSQEPSGPREIVLVDSNSTDATCEVAGRYDDVRVIPIAEFSHGRARNLGAREASGAVIVFMSQDALPRDGSWLAKLVEPFNDEKVAATYSRQVPRADANPMERFFLMTHFPDRDAEMREKQAGQEPTLKSVFFSNVSSAVRRELLLTHPFDETLIMSEDQQLSRDLINDGYAVAYAPDSVVIHSHNYSLKAVFKRYFDSVYSLTLIFPAHKMGTSVSMGVGYVFRELWYVLKTAPHKLIHCLFYSFCRCLGTILAHCATWLPRSWCAKMSLHSYYWR